MPEMYAFLGECILFSPGTSPVEGEKKRKKNKALFIQDINLQIS